MDMADHQTLFDLRPGDSGRISGFHSEEVPMKFYELGIIPGSFITLKKRLPFDGPVCVQLMESVNFIALRGSEARSIIIEKFL